MLLFLLISYLLIACPYVQFEQEKQNKSFHSSLYSKRMNWPPGINKMSPEFCYCCYYYYPYDLMDLMNLICFQPVALLAFLRLQFSYLVHWKPLQTDSESFWHDPRRLKVSLLSAHVIHFLLQFSSVQWLSCV